MSFADSPKLEYSADGKPPETGRLRHRIVRPVIVLLVLAAVIVNVVIWVQGNTVNRLAGTDGVIQGQVLLPDGQPLADAEVFLMSAPVVISKTNANGEFTLKNVPTGEQTLLIGFNDRAEQVPINVTNEGATHAGPVTFTTPVSDDYWR